VLLAPRPLFSLPRSMPLILCASPGTVNLASLE
jgi:hypothetical protein